MRVRAWNRVVVVLVAACWGIGLSGGVAHAEVTLPDLRCDPGDRSCDVDNDRIPDAVEQVVCGSATCATGAEDVDGDGVPDYTERLTSTGNLIEDEDPGERAWLAGLDTGAR